MFRMNFRPADARLSPFSIKRVRQGAIVAAMGLAVRTGMPSINRSVTFHSAVAADCGGLLFRSLDSTPTGMISSVTFKENDMHCRNLVGRYGLTMSSVGHGR